MVRDAPFRIALTLLAVLAPATAFAQGDATRARALFDQGVAAMDRGDPASATGLFSNSYQAYPRASTACNLALSLERTGRACEASRWYQQCASMDREGRFGHASGQASALSSQCTPSQPASPFVSGPQPPTGGVQVVESAPPPAYSGPGPSHVLLGVGIGALVIGGASIGGGAAAAGEANAQADRLPTGGVLTAPDDIEAYDQARTFSNVALGLYIGGGIVAALGVTMILVDLAQPGVFGGRASRDRLRLAVTPLPEGGAAGALRVLF